MYVCKLNVTDRVSRYPGSISVASDVVPCFYVCQFASLLCLFAWQAEIESRLFVIAGLKLEQFQGDSSNSTDFVLLSSMSCLQLVLVLRAKWSHDRPFPTNRLGRGRLRVDRCASQPSR